VRFACWNLSASVAANEGQHFAEELGHIVDPTSRTGLV